jgi:hypothetical protein
MPTSTAFNRPAANRFGGRRSVPVAPAPASVEPTNPPVPEPSTGAVEGEQATPVTAPDEPSVGAAGMTPDPEPAAQPIQPEQPPKRANTQRKQQKAPDTSLDGTPAPAAIGADSAGDTGPLAKLLILDAGQISYADPSIHVLDLDNVRAVDDPRDIVDVIAALSAVADTEGKARALHSLTQILTTKALAR